MFNQISQTVKESGEHALPAIDESVTTVKQVNKTLEDVNAVTDAARTTATNVGALTDLYGAFLGKPVVKIASACYALKDTFKATVPTDAAESSARHAANSGESFTPKGE